MSDIEGWEREREKEWKMKINKKARNERKRTRNEKEREREPACNTECSTSFTFPISSSLISPSTYPVSFALKIFLLVFVNFVTLTIP